MKRTKIFDELLKFSEEMNFEIYTKFSVRYNMMFFRFEIYLKYLNETSEIFDKVLLSDLNDVIFQGDPFLIDFDDEIYCALECNILTDKNNSSSKLNVSWINECSHLPKIDSHNYQNKYVICAGTILGNYFTIYDYLYFYKKVQSKKKVNDQGLLNVCVYNYLTDRVKLINYKKSRILTLDKISFGDLKIGDDGSILNENNEKYIIIHQIDRCNFNFMLGLVE